MKKTIAKSLSVFLAAVVLFGSAVSGGFAGSNASALDVPDYEIIAGIEEAIITDFESYGIVSSDMPLTTSAVSPFDGGTGTEEDPYIISTKVQLVEVNNYLDCCFKLANDIVFETADFDVSGDFYNGGEGFIPLATDAPFTGVFDGNNHVIKGIEMYYEPSLSEVPAVGLFNLLAGTVKNLGMVDGLVAIKSSDEVIYAGSIAALADDGAEIINCYNNCDILVYAECDADIRYNGVFECVPSVGGILGAGNIKVTDCYNEGSIMVIEEVYVTSNNYYGSVNCTPVVGGIAGTLAVIEGCYNSGDIYVAVGIANNGAVGAPQDDVSIGVMAGGIGGLCSDISNCYNSGAVSINVVDEFGSSYTTVLPLAAGIMPTVQEDVTVSNCYNTGVIDATDYAGGITVLNLGTIENCYYLDNNSYGVIVDQGSASIDKCTESEMASESTYKDFDFENTWAMGEDGVPVLIATLPKHTVKWVVDGVETEAIVAEKAKIEKPENPSKQGYDFAGWSPAVPERMGEADVTYTAKWTPRNDTKYVVETYVQGLDGKYTVSKENKQGTTDAKATAAAPAKTGFGIDKAKSVLEGNIAPDGSLVLKVYYNRNSYELTTVIDGKSSTEKIKYGEAVTAPKVADKTGYEFAGWSPEFPATMPAEDVKVEAVYDCIAEISIANNPGSKTIKYGETLRLTANITDKPDDAVIAWYLDGAKVGEGESCDVTFESGTKTVEVKLLDAEGNVLQNADGNEIADSEEVTVNAGFFQKIISFFKNLFGIDRTVVQ